MVKVPLEKCVHFAGLRRSGNHGVIDWILGHHNNWTHYNNVVNDSTEQWSIKGTSSNDFQLASFEDYPLSYLPPGEKILLLRDPFNTFASRLQHLRNSLDNVDFYKDWQDYGDFYSHLNLVSSGAFDIWKQYAKAYLNGDFVINFNKWFSDLSYRKEISEKMNVEHTDREFHSNKGYQFSRGSSFKKFDPLNSWQNMREEDEYLAYFDEEIIELSREIFGDPPDLKFNYQSIDYVENLVEVTLNLCAKNQFNDAAVIIRQGVKTIPNNTRLIHIQKLVAYI